MTGDLHCYSFIQDHSMRIALRKHMENMKFDHAYVKEKDNLIFFLHWCIKTNRGFLIMDMIVNRRCINEAWGRINFQKHREKVDTPTFVYKGEIRRSRFIRDRKWKGEEG